MGNHKLILAFICIVAIIVLLLTVGINKRDIADTAAIVTPQTGIQMTNCENDVNNHGHEIKIDYTVIKVSRGLEEPAIYENNVVAAPVEEETKAPFFEIDDYNRWVIKCIVAGEAGGEPYEGKKAVAQCIMNAMAKEGYTAEQVQYNYQYSGWNSQIEYSHPDVWEEISNAVSDVFDKGESITTNPILYFYAPAICYSSWHESLPHDQTIGGHKFFYLEEDKTADWYQELYGEKIN